MKRHVVITRPAHQAGVLCQQIQAAGGEVTLFPTLAIEQLEPTEETHTLLSQINQYDLIIFISPNAVEYGLNLIQATTALADSTKLVTIGQGSAKILLNKLGKGPDITPEKNFNSEGLLATPALQNNIQQKRILIIRGNGGREVLKDTLEQRGAMVDYLEVYKRVKPSPPSGEIQLQLQNKQIAAIVITSAESLKNLLELVPEVVNHQLLETPLILINSRLVAVAKEAGFNGKLFCTEEASDEAIVNTLQDNNLLS